MHRSLITLLLTAVVVGPLAATERDTPEASEALSIVIAVPKHGDERRLDLRNPKSHFHVIVTNTSNREQRLWETWNSWGYFNLEFDVVDDQGAVAFQITKNRNKRWTVNFPSWVALKPGEHFVMDVYFDRETWIMPFLKTPESQGRFTLKLRAVLEITSDDEALEHGVWTGKITSTADDFSVGYWRASKPPITKR